MTNKELINKYPWLLPRNRFTDKVNPNYDYNYTELDDMPDGWRVAFGEQLCEEVNNELLTWEKEDYDEFRILQIKEKYGELRFYVNYSSHALYEIIEKYTQLSRKTCIQCGKPARWISRGWIFPYCDDCLDPEKKKNIEKYYEKIEEC